MGCESEETPPTPKTRETSWRSRQTETPCFPTSSSNHFTGQRSVTWITNSVNCGRGSHTNEKQGTAVLFASQNLDVCYCSRLSHRAHGLLRAPLGQNGESSQGKAEAGVFASTSTTRGVMKGNIPSIKSFCSPDLEISYASVSTVLATEGIYSDHNHGCLYPPQPTQTRHSGELYRNISEQKPRTQMQLLLSQGTLIKPTSKQ